MNDTSQERFQRMVGRRIQIARDELGLSQEELSKQLGFPVRQTLSNIEAGKRKVTAEELMKFMQTLKKNLDFFTDSFLMIGEATVSWRAKDVPKTLDDFEKFLEFSKKVSLKKIHINSYAKRVSEEQS